MDLDKHVMPAPVFPEVNFISSKTVEKGLVEGKGLMSFDFHFAKKNCYEKCHFLKCNFEIDQKF